MKKHLLLFVFALAASALQAQNNDMYSIMHHEWAGHRISCDGIMQQRDGDLITSSFVYEHPENGNINPLGQLFYKISPTTLAITDSLLIADTNMMSYYQLAQNPNGEGNILTKFEYREDCDSCFLHICHFSDNVLNPVEDVVVPVCEGQAEGGVSIVDHRGDLIVQYYKETDPLHINEYAARFGMDGTLKHQAVLSENTLRTNTAGQLYVLKESPQKFYQWGSAETNNHGYENLTIYTVDSIFHRNPMIINSKFSTAYEYFFFQYDTEVIPVGGDDILVAAEYVYEANPYNPEEKNNGVAIAKYDLRTMQPKGYITFNDYPGTSGSVRCLGIKMMTDGTIYFLYWERGYPDESFVAVKMDANLNVEWRRFYKTDNIVLYWLQYPVLCKDEQGEEKGIVWSGYGWTVDNDHPFILFYLNHDGTVSVNEGGIEVRPYGYYPNPVKEQLQMQFSPDVQPAQVELYDLQGRLVRTQSKAFESINLSQLPAGTYMMRVSLEDGKSYADKVVKE